MVRPPSRTVIGVACVARSRGWPISAVQELVGFVLMLYEPRRGHRVWSAGTIGCRSTRLIVGYGLGHEARAGPRLYAQCRGSVGTSGGEAIKGADSAVRGQARGIRTDVVKRQDAQSSVRFGYPDGCVAGATRNNDDLVGGTRQTCEGHLMRAIRPSLGNTGLPRGSGRLGHGGGGVATVRGYAVWRAISDRNGAERLGSRLWGESLEGNCERSHSGRLARQVS